MCLFDVRSSDIEIITAPLLVHLAATDQSYFYGSSYPRVDAWYPSHDNSQCGRFRADEAKADGLCMVFSF
jgi:hypothetical protein